MAPQETSARRLEAAEAANATGCMGNHPDGAFIRVGGGVAVFTGAESPLTHAVGLGLDGPVSRAEIDRMEDFFRSRGARCTIDLCPFADSGLVEELARRGYRLLEFNNVLVRRMAGVEMALTPRVRRSRPDEVDLWSHTVGRGFFEIAELTTPEMDVGRAICGMPGAITFVAVDPSSAPAGGAAMAVHSGLASLFADSTLPAFRRQGIHRELIAARLNEALAQACDFAMAATIPGSISQRNYERAGFAVVYTKVTLVA